MLNPLSTEWQRSEIGSKPILPRRCVHRACSVLRADTEHVQQTASMAAVSSVDAMPADYWPVEQSRHLASMTTAGRGKRQGR